MTRELLLGMLATAIAPALALLPRHLDSQAVRVLMLAIGLQESRFTHRYQVVAGGGKGPARSFWQCELGSRASHGGVWGVYLHHQSMELLRLLCRERDVSFDPVVIWEAIETDDILAAGVARLLLWTDAAALPVINDVAGAWTCYAERVWRPGKPHRETWDAFHAAAVDAVMVPDLHLPDVKDTDL